MFSLIQNVGIALERDGGRSASDVMEALVIPTFAQWRRDGTPFSREAFQKVFAAVDAAHRHILPTFTKNDRNMPYAKTPEQRVANASARFEEFQELFWEWFASQDAQK